MKYLKYFESYNNVAIGNTGLTQEDINLILKGYIDCALWSEEERLQEDNVENQIDFNEEEDNDETEMDDIERLIHSLREKTIVTFTKEDIEVDALISAYTDIKKFIELAGIEAVKYAITENGLERLGHDIWLTRNGHGAGFFDHGYDDEIEKKLIHAGQELKARNMYITEEGMLAFDI